MGNYKIVEVNAPKEYNLAVAQSINVLPGKTTSSKFIDTFVKGQIQVIKIDSKTGVKLEGAVFSVVNTITKKEVTKITTGKSGVGTSALLTYGKYEVTEIKAPTGYLLNKEVKTVDINKDKQIIKFTVKDNLIPTKGNIIVNKTNESGKPLEGAVFNLVQNNEVIETKITDKNGVVSFSNIKQGAYQIIEKNAPLGYNLAKIQNINVVAEKTTDVRFIDAVITSKFEIIKTNNLGAFLSGAKFEILDNTGNVVKKVTTGIDGIANFGILPYGKYTYKEVKAPVGYKINLSVGTFEVTKQGEIITKSVIDEKIETIIVPSHNDTNMVIDNNKDNNSDKIVIKDSGNNKTVVEKHYDKKKVQKTEILPDTGFNSMFDFIKIILVIFSITILLVVFGKKRKVY